MLIDVGSTFDNSIKEKEEKLNSYDDLNWELQILWSMRRVNLMTNSLCKN